MLKVIDISKYQPTVDYQAVKDAGVNGVILRCGLTYWGAQNMGADELFSTHYNGFKKVGMPVGAYYYSAADTIEMAKKEAEFVKTLLVGKQFAFPIYYDVENDERMSKLSKETLTTIVETFCESLENAGYFVGVYANTNYFQNKLDHARLAKKYTLWLADYRGDNANQSLLRDMWQYTSSGSVKGIAGNVDVNECYRDFPSVIKMAGLNGFTKEEQSTKPVMPKPSVKTYTVKSGDSFWKIAAEQLGNGNRYKELAEYNGMTANSVIHPGDILKLPDGSGSTSPKPSVKKTYTVKSGDSFWKIAAEQLGNGNRYKELAEYNGMTANSVIHPGDILKLP